MELWELEYDDIPEEQRLPWMPDFLRNLDKTGNVYRSALAAGISSRQVYTAREKKPAFAQAWSHLIDAGTEDVLQNWVELARNGHKEYRVDRNGEVVETTTHYPPLIMRLAACRRPKQYGAQAGEFDGDRVVRRVIVELTPEDPNGATPAED